MDTHGDGPYEDVPGGRVRTSDMDYVVRNGITVRDMVRHNDEINDIATAAAQKSLDEGIPVKFEAVYDYQAARRRYLAEIPA